MTAILLDGKKVADEIAENIKCAVEKMAKKPKLAVVLVGENEASKVYVSAKEKMARKLGFEFELIKLDKDVTRDELKDVILGLNKSDADGILIQLPLPKHLNEDEFASLISPNKDADGFHPLNLGFILRGEVPYAISCTPKGIMTLIKKYNINLEGLNVLIIGRSNIVGKPLVPLLLKENATVTVAHSKTKNLKEISNKADVIISATGVPHLIKEDMVKEGAIVIDVGVSKDEKGKIVGDVDFEHVKNIASYITPNPKGVGPMTVISLMENVLELASKRNNL